MLGLHQLSKTKVAVDRLNRVGEYVIYNKYLRYLNARPFRIFNIYSIYTGTNRGYTFFSPNITPIKAAFSFYDHDRELTIPLKTRESRSKMIVATYFLLTNVDKEAIRNDVLKAMSSRIFSLNPEVYQLDVYLDYERYAYLSAARRHADYIERKHLKAFTITRDKK
ncbi:hypothetical protein CK934_19435 [Chitinophaga sp. MD30]|nr:hypothetical protein CK934_19435 [Chitinophaga sp. MD30]